MSKLNLQKIVEATKNALKKRDDKLLELEERLDDSNTGGSALRLQVDHVRVKGSVKIDKFPDVQKVAGSVEITNFPKEQSVHVLNLKEIVIPPVDIKFPDIQKVKIEDQGLKAEDWLPDVLTRIGINQSKFLAKLIAEGISVRLVKDDQTPIAVQVFDDKGRILKDIAGRAGGGISMGGGGGRNLYYVPTRITSGRKTTNATTPVQLVAASTKATSITITALATNSTLVYVGGSTTSATGGAQQGIILSPLGMVTLPIDDVSKVWLDAETSGDGVIFTYQS